MLTAVLTARPSVWTPSTYTGRPMASLFKEPNGVYYLSFFDSSRRPRRKQVSLRTRTLRTAETLRRRLEDAHALGGYDPWVEPDWKAPRDEGASLALLGDALEAFLASRSHFSPHTVAKYEMVLGGLVGSAGADTPTATVTTAHVAAYLDGTRTRPVSKRSYAGAISAFFNWAVREGARSDNPVAALALPRVPQKHARYLSQADVEALCAEIEEDGARAHKGDSSGRWLLPIVRANVYLGLRASELTHVRWDHVDLGARTLLVANTETFTTKAGRERTLPLSAPVLAVLDDLERRAEWVFPNASGGHLHRNYLSRAFKRYVRAAGLPEHVCFHTTRHTCASWLAERGTSVEAIRAYLGHSSVAVTERYMHLSPSSLASQVARAFESDSDLLGQSRGHP